MVTTLSAKGNYLFNRDDRASIRLNYNHWLITQHTGYLLHPDIPTDLTNLHIADVGTGTGIWLIELSTKLPASTKLYGFDISSAQFPISEWLPPNVRLHVHDAFSPFAEEYQGSFDIVSMRFMTTVYSETNFPILIRNLATLLKPGGHLQCIDLDPLSPRALTVNAEVPSDETRQLASLMQQSSASVSHSNTLGDIGLQQIVHDSIGIPCFFRTLWNHSHLMGVEELWKKRIELSGSSPEVLREAGDAVEKLRKEMRSGTNLDTKYFCIVSKKV